MKPLTQVLNGWFTPARFALLAGCLIAASFLGVITGQDTFFYRDFALFSYPLAAYHKQSFWNGEIPLWNPYNNCGLPFLAQWNTMVFYPLSFIYLLLPLPWSLNFFCLLHFWLAGLGMYFLARSWTGSQFASALAGLGFIFSGLLLSSLKWPNTVAALACMPWVVLTVDRAIRGNLRSVGLAALVGAAQMLTGTPEIVILTWIFSGVMMLQTSFTKPGEPRVVISKFLLVVLLVTGLSAVQLLPFLDFIKSSQRDETFHGSEWPMPAWGWANFLLPLFRMLPSYHGVPVQPGQFWISTYYVSIAILLLAIVALSKVRTSRVWLLGGLLLFSMWMALGEQGLLYKWLLTTVPGISAMRFPIKFILLAAFILPLLGAIGLAHLLSSSNPIRPKTLWIPAAMIGTSIVALMVYSEIAPFRYTGTFRTTNNGLWRLFFLGLSTAILFKLARQESSHAKIGAWLLLIIVAADGISHATWQNPAAPAWVYDGTAAEVHPVPRLGESRAMVSPEAAEKMNHLKFDTPAEDVMASRLSLFADLNLLERIPKVDGFYSIYPRAMSQLQDWMWSSTNVPPAALLDFLAVTQITAPGSWNKWEHRTNALPFVTSPTRVRLSSEGIKALFQPEFNPREEVLFSKPLPSISTNFVKAEVTSVLARPHQIEVQASAKDTALLVLSQTFYHCWRATIDGQSTEIFPANFGFQAIVLPPGSHTVSFKYSDSAFRIGAIISFVTAAAVSMLILLCKTKTR